MDDVITSPSFNNSVNYGEKVETSTPYLRYGLIFLVLAFLGFNIFTYLGNITQFFADIFGPIIARIVAFFGIAAAETTKKAVEVTAKGVKTGVDVAAATVTTSANVVEKAVTGGYKQMGNNIGSKGGVITSGTIGLDQALNKALSTSSQQEPEPDDSASRIQATTANKSGYCFVGENRGIRSCVKVSEADRCMSGNIFPTRDICINPTLRE